MRTPWQGKQFKNGLILSYKYPPDLTEPSEIRLHFEYVGSYIARENSTIRDATTATEGILEDMREMKDWLIEQGMPSKISGRTYTHFLLRILKNCGFTISEPSDDCKEWNFELQTKDMKPENLYEDFVQGIEGVLVLARNLEIRRYSRSVEGR